MRVYYIIPFMPPKILQKLENFFSRYKNISFEKGQVIIGADGEPSGIFYLKQGYIRQHSLSALGKDKAVNIFKPPSFFPMIWALTDAANSYYFEAMSDGSGFLAPKDEVVEFVKKNPDVLLNLTERVMIGVSGLLNIMEQMMFDSAYHKLIGLLLIFARRFGKRKGREVVFNLKLTHQDIASFIGSIRETVSVEMQNLKKKGLIEYHGSIIEVKNLEALEKELNR